MSELINLPLHHIGFAVRILEDTLPSFEALGTRFYREYTDIERNLDFVFGEIGGVKVELVSPHNDKMDCAVTNYVKRQSCTPYHLCFLTDNIDEELVRLKKRGFKQIGKRMTSDIYGTMTTGVFLFSLGMGLVEIVMECVK